MWRQSERKSEERAAEPFELLAPLTLTMEIQVPASVEVEVRPVQVQGKWHAA
jgi:hypothetical protein